jgi:hypothetical protein
MTPPSQPKEASKKKRATPKGRKAVARKVGKARAKKGQKNPT